MRYVPPSTVLTILATSLVTNSTSESEESSSTEYISKSDSDSSVCARSELPMPMLPRRESVTGEELGVELMTFSPVSS